MPVPAQYQSDIIEYTLRKNKCCDYWFANAMSTKTLGLDLTQPSIQRNEENRSIQTNKKYNKIKQKLIIETK